MIKHVLGKTLKNIPPSQKASPEVVLKTVADYFQLKTSQLKGNKRDKVKQGKPVESPVGGCHESNVEIHKWSVGKCNKLE